MTTMLQTLDETAGTYTSETRAIDSGDKCRYFINGKCCAVGRCMINPEKCANFFGSVSQFNDIDRLLKPEYRGFPIDFWRALQYFHDRLIYWDENGLSDTGKKQVDNIKKEFNL